MVKRVSVFGVSFCLARTSVSIALDEHARICLSLLTGLQSSNLIEVLGCHLWTRLPKFQFLI